MLRTFPWFSQVPQSKFEANQSKGLWIMIGQTNKQTNRQVDIINFMFINADAPKAFEEGGFGSTVLDQ